MNRVWSSGNTIPRSALLVGNSSYSASLTYDEKSVFGNILAQQASYITISGSN